MYQSSPDLSHAVVGVSDTMYIYAHDALVAQRDFHPGLSASQFLQEPNLVIPIQQHSTSD